MATTIANLLQDIRHRTGLFSPLAFRSERFLARAAAPAVIAAAGGVRQAGIRGKSDTRSALAAALGAIEQSRIGRLGAMERQRLMSETDIEKQKIASEGLRKVAEEQGYQDIEKTKLELDFYGSETERARRAGNIPTVATLLEEIRKGSGQATGEEDTEVATPVPETLEQKKKRKKEELDMWRNLTF